MKKFILSLVMGIFAMMSFAQDVIVKKDGTTILSKVTELSDTEVKYKRYDNLDGPTIIVKVSDLQCINYENGTKATFNSTPVVDTPAKETTVTYPNNSYGVTGERKYSDAELIRMNRGNSDWHAEPKKGKVLRNVGLIGGGTLVAFGVLLAMGDDVPPYDVGIGWGIAAIAGGTIIGTTMYCIGNSKIKKAKENLSYSSLYQYNIPLGKNTMLTADVDLIKDRMTRQQTLGLGFHLNF